MSADNCVAILKTTDKFILQDNGNTLINTFGKGVTAYRVRHIQAHDNFYWYLENEIHNLGAWMQSEFGKVHPVYDPDEAFKIAHKLFDSIPYVEYGIVELDASKYNFPGC